MFFQKMLIGVNPYFLSVGNIQKSGFDTHYHRETEVCFCLRGTCEIMCRSDAITLFEGDFAVISPMTAHSVPKKDGADGEAIVVEFGHAFLGKYNEYFASQSESAVVIRKSDEKDDPRYSELSDLLYETAMFKKRSDTFDELYIRSNLYSICARLLCFLKKSASKTKNIGNIENALEIIYNRYSEPLDIETVSAICGYSKSSFCRVFKNVTGDTFHALLNRHRIEIACHLLKESAMTVEEISHETGFSDSKSFCRVFKSVMDMSAGEYRKTV